MRHWISQILVKLGFAWVIGAIIISQSFAAGVQESRGKVTRDQEFILTFYFNCKGPLAPITATAEKGSVHVEPSTRQICEHNFQPVQQIVYRSPKDYTGLDIVRFYVKGQLNVIKTLEVGAERSERLKGLATRTMVLAPGEERLVATSWDCAKPEKAKLPYISKSKGVIDIRDSTAAVCGSSTFPVRKIFYRAQPSFIGEDEVVIAGAFGPPIDTKLIIGKSEEKSDSVETARANSQNNSPVVTPAPAPITPASPEEQDPSGIVTELAKLDEDQNRALSIWDDDKGLARFFTQGFMSDWRKAHKRGGTVLDRDPLTLSQNSQGMHILEVLSHEVEGDEARVTVLFEERSADDGKVYLPARSALFNLKHEGGGWLIEEVKVFGTKTKTTDGKTDPEALAMAEGLHAYLKYYQDHPHTD